MTSYGTDKPNVLEFWVKMAKNDIEGQGQWPPFSIPAEGIPGCMFGANLVILTQICDELSCGQDKVYGRTDGRTDGRTQAPAIPLRPERPRGKKQFKKPTTYDWCSMRLPLGRIKTPLWFKDSLSGFWDFHYKDTTVVRPSYLYHGNSFIGKTVSLYWDTPGSSPL